MEILTSKFREVLLSVSPIVVIVLLLALTLIEIPADMLWRFLIGTIFLILGLTIFLFGIEVGMQPIGEKFGRLVTESGHLLWMGILAFIIGFVVTVAEPDLLILGQEVSTALNEAISSSTIVLSVSLGVGLMISLGVYRILLSYPIKHFFLAVYGLVLILAIFSSNSAIAMAFDASGATTGALTTPFILALGTAVSARKGGKRSEEDSFGLVGAMSVGPILMMLILSLRNRAGLSGHAVEFTYTEGIWHPFFRAMGATFKESLLALAPLIIIFLKINYLKLKLSSSDLLDIFKGILYTLGGLALFLVGVNQGFMEMGRFIGERLADQSQALLPLMGFLLGAVVVLAEPAVHVLAEQVEEVTGGFIKEKLLLGSLSIGVAVAVAATLIRIMTPSIEIWHYLLPGFVLSVILSYKVDPLFTGIAFDAGGVASGPMTATFLLAFAQGAASFLPQADLVKDGFGIIATVAMTPIVTLQLLGLIFKLKSRNTQTKEVQ